MFRFRSFIVFVNACTKCYVFWCCELWCGNIKLVYSSNIFSIETKKSERENLRNKDVFVLSSAFNLRVEDE